MRNLGFACPRGRACIWMELMACAARTSIFMVWRGCRRSPHKWSLDSSLFSETGGSFLPEKWRDQIPIKVTGKREHPSFGLDFHHKKEDGKKKPPIRRRSAARATEAKIALLRKWYWTRDQRILLRFRQPPRKAPDILGGGIKGAHPACHGLFFVPYVKENIFTAGQYSAEESAQTRRWPRRINDPTCGIPRNLSFQELRHAIGMMRILKPQPILIIKPRIAAEAKRIFDDSCILACAGI